MRLYIAPETQNGREWFRLHARIHGQVLPRCNMVRNVTSLDRRRSFTR